LRAAAARSANDISCGCVEDGCGAVFGCGDCDCSSKAKTKAKR